MSWETAGVWAGVILGLLTSLVGLIIWQLNRRLETMEKQVDALETSHITELAALRRELAEAERRQDGRRDESLRRAFERMETLEGSFHDVDRTVAGFNGIFMPRLECIQKHNTTATAIRRRDAP